MLHVPLRARLLALLTGLAALTPLLVTSAAPAVAAPDMRRLAGADRFSTAVAVSQAGHPDGAPVAVLATGADFPDALAGGPAAAALGGPVLLVSRDSVPSVVLEELTRLAPERVLLLGGTGAVSEQVEDELDAAGLDVERIAGASRYETAALVSQEVFAAAPAVAYVATGADYPDALAGAAAAGAAGAPVLLVAPDAVPRATAAELGRLTPTRVIVLGGTGAVSAKVEQQLAALAPTLTRISGADRYATAAAIARAAPGRPAAIFLATGEGFADALAGGPAAAAAGASVLLVPPTCIPGRVHIEMERHGYPPVTLLGGPAALGPEVVDLQPCFPAPDGQLAPGVELSTLADPDGPWTGKVVAVAPDALWRLDTVLAQDALPGLETTSSMARRTSALVAVNGDFALAGGRPVHAFAKDGRLLQSNDRDWRVIGRTVAVTDQSSPVVHVGEPAQDVRLTVSATGTTALVQHVNRGPADPGGLALRTSEGGWVASVPGDSCAARLRRTGVPAVRDGDVVQAYEVVAEGRCAATPLEPGQDDVLTAPVDGEQAGLVESLQPGEQVELAWSLGWPDVVDALGGNPTVVEDGEVVEGNVAGTDPFSARNPRTAVGRRADGSVLLVTVNGRGADGSAGMTLRELAELFVELEATEALNLDGGGSSALVVGGELQTWPSDGLERPVSSALVVLPGSAPGQFGALSTAAVRPAVPLPVAEQRAAELAQLADPGSTGGLLARP